MKRKKSSFNLKPFGRAFPTWGVRGFFGCEANDLHASDGRDTEALNCKPITNL
jgi:hypothetical protein